MKLLIKSTLVLLFLLPIGCTPFANNLDDVALECGQGATDLTALYIKVLDKDGNPLSNEAINRLEANSEDGGGSIPITSSGCLIMKNGTNLVSANALSLSQSFSKVIDSEKHFQRIKLSPYPEVQADVNCPDEGIFANDAFSNIWNISAESNTENYAFNMVAINQSNGQILSLFEKRLGEVQKPIPNTFSTKNFPEGIYRLEASIKENAKGWNIAPRLLISNNLCQMTVIHQNIFSSKNISNFRTLKSSSALDLGIDSEKYKTFFCFQARTKNGFTSNCEENKSKCNNLSEFSSGKIYSPEEPGLYDLFTFTKDKAENSSETACQTLAVSKSSPTISLRWEKENLNRTISFFDLPYAALNARIEVSHTEVPKEVLLKNLECKMEIQTQGLFPVKGELIDCISGKCSGKNLSEFSPCDENISISLARAWEMPGFSKSVLSLHVRTNDGAGNDSTKILNVIVNDSRWEIVPLPLPPGDDQQSIELLADNTYLSYAWKTKKMYRVVEGNFQETNLSLENLESYSFYTDSERTVWFAWSEKNSTSSYNMHLSKYKDGVWEKISIHENSKLNRVMSDGFDGFFVSAERELGKYDVYHHRGNSVDEIKIDMHCYMSPNTLVYRAKNDTYYESCTNKTNYRKTDGKWFVFKGFKFNDGEMAGEIILDSRRNLLVSVATSERNREKLLYYDFSKAQVKTIEFRESSLRIPMDWYFFKDALGDLFRGRYIWNSIDEVWEDGRARLQIYPRLSASKSKTTFNTHTFWDEHGTFVRTERETIYLSALGNQMTMDMSYQTNVEKSEYFFLASKNSLSNAHFKLRRKKLIDLGSGHLAIPRRIDSFEREIFGRQTIASDRTMYEMIDNNWRAIGSNFDFYQKINGDIVYLVNENSDLDMNLIKPNDVSVSASPTEDIFEDSEGDLWTSNGYGTLGIIKGSVASTIFMDTFDYLFAVDDNVYAADSKNQLLSFSKENFETPLTVENSKFGINRVPTNCKMQKGLINKLNRLFFMCSKKEPGSDHTTYTDFYVIDAKTDANDSPMKHFELPENKEYVSRTLNNIISIDDAGRIYIACSTGIYRWDENAWKLMVSTAEVFEKTGEDFAITNYRVQRNGDIWISAGFVVNKVFLLRAID